jgi:hypothetical protein
LRNNVLIANVINPTPIAVEYCVCCA